MSKSSNDPQEAHTARLDRFFNYPHERSTAARLRAFGIPVRSNRDDASGRDAWLWETPRIGPKSGTVYSVKRASQIADFKRPGLSASTDKSIYNLLKDASDKGASSLVIDLTDTELDLRSLRTELARRVGAGRRVPRSIIVLWQAELRPEMKTFDPAEIARIGSFVGREPVFTVQGQRSSSRSGPQTPLVL